MIFRKGKDPKSLDRKHISPLGAILPIFSAALVLFLSLFLVTRGFDRASIQPAEDWGWSERFNAIVDTAMVDAEKAALSVKKQFWLSEDATEGPVPKQENFGSTNDPTSLQWLLDEAAPLLDGQETLFSTDVELFPGSSVTYYLDETILAITWKQMMDGSVYTISEVKVGHASQFRRHLTENRYNSWKLSIPTEMSKDVNAVVGTSADHYLGRKYGIIVYDREVRRVDYADQMDTCFIDGNGDLQFAYAGDLKDMESAQKYVDENDILFSIAFGPILIDNGVRCEPYSYMIGEVNDHYARAALCQMDDLHYLVVVANYEPGCSGSPTIHTFAENVLKLGCEKAYTLDGGNTGSIVMNGKLINRLPFITQRLQGDLLYFCTALPNQDIENE